LYVAGSAVAVRLAPDEVRALLRAVRRSRVLRAAPVAVPAAFDRRLGAVRLGIRSAPPLEFAGAVQRQRDSAHDEQDDDEKKNCDATSHGLITTRAPARQTAFALSGVRRRCRSRSWSTRRRGS